MSAGTRDPFRIDPARCAGVGICLHVAADVVRADSWGYPILTQPVDEHSDRQADAAVRACPRKALLRG